LPEHDIGEPEAQRTVQSSTLVHSTLHRPSHSTTQDDTLVQSTLLFGPTRTPQRSTSWQL
jgi:hypothetical protein